MNQPPLAERPRTELGDHFTTTKSMTVNLDPATTFNAWPNSQIPECTIFGIPREVRDQILSYLLINPVLGTPESVDLDQHGRSTNFGLSAAILQTCRQFYEEGSEMLYGQNSFYCITGSLRALRWEWGTPTPVILSPILGHKEDIPLAHHSIVRKVRSWKLVISNTDGARESPERCLDLLCELCQIIALSSKRHVEVSIVPRGILVEKGVDVPIVHTLNALRVLRCTAEVVIRDATLADIPDKVQVRREPIVFESVLSGSQAAMIEMVKLLQKEEIVELGIEMYPLLLIYVRSFEQYKPFQYDMDIDVFRFPRGITNGIEICRESKYHADNPYKGPLIHPVEAGLMAAKAAAWINDLKEFKTQRYIVLMYLEQQYRRLESASINIVDFIKNSKRRYGTYEYAAEGCNGAKYLGHDYPEAMGLLEDYGSALERDVPSYMMTQFRTQKRRLDSIRGTRKYEMLLERLRKLNDLDDYHDFQSWFREAVDEFEERFLVIRRARNDILSKDKLNNPECDLNLIVSNLDERIDWEVTEPDMDLASPDFW